jgi:hypothetical protein
MNTAVKPEGAINAEAAATAGRETSVGEAPGREYLVPILARGRLIMPDADALDLGGRKGARFRCPSPAKHIRDLVLPNASDLRDLQQMPVDRIIDFLVELGPRLTLSNPHMREAFALALEAGGLTEPVLRSVYAQVPTCFDRLRLEHTVDKCIGKNYLDGWVEQGEQGQPSMFRVRAFGTRGVHITAGNVPIVAAITVVRSALTKSDSLIKLPSNDPLTASAIVRTMIEMDPTHPVTRHFAVAYWRGGDVEVERELYKPQHIERITAWGGMSSLKHIRQYLVPGVELIGMNPKLSMSIVGKEGLADDTAMSRCAVGIALMAGRLNQTACSSTRVVYVECDTDEDSLERLERLGRHVQRAFAELPASESTPAPRANRELEDELRAIELSPDYYRVHGDTIRGGVIISRTEEPVEFSARLENRIVNLVPVADITRVVQWVSESTQTIGIYPDSLRVKLRDDLALHGAQRTIALGESLFVLSSSDTKQMAAQTAALPHDGMEPMRRMVKWVIDQSVGSG